MQIIFFGNGLLAENVLQVLRRSDCEIIFHARAKDDLVRACELKKQNPAAHAILASFGVIIPLEVLQIFEPEGIINLHPSLLPKYRGPSPIETAILDGETELGISIMKLAEKMDAGPIYYQTALTFDHNAAKVNIYEQLATAGATWLVGNLQKADAARTTLDKLSEPSLQNDHEATFTQKLTTDLSSLDPAQKSALELHNQVRAFQKFPKSRLKINDFDCIILKTHVSDQPEKPVQLSIKCADGKYLVIDELQPAGKKPMLAVAFANGYLRSTPSGKSRARRVILKSG